MKKFIKIITYGCAILTIAFLLTSCHANIDWGNGIDGNGKVTKQTRKVENNFSKIDVSRGLNVTLEQSSSYSVEVEADENLQEHITTRVENGTLMITTDENIDEAKARNIYVKLPAVTTITTTSGSSTATKNTFTGTDILVKTSSGSSANLKLEVDLIKCESSSGSTLTLTGKALQLKVASSSGSSIEAKNLLVNEVKAEATSGSTIDVHPILKLMASASSGSSIDYVGEPQTVSKEENSGGSVSKD
ncbi:MAG: hypothetical protein RL427_94 [Bacteroidota bacterium]